MNSPAWPTRPDGTQMTLGEMTPEQRSEQVAAACKKFERQLQAAAPAIAKVLAEFDVADAGGANLSDFGRA